MKFNNKYTHKGDYQPVKLNELEKSIIVFIF